jgi:hypothetical protein
MNCAVEMGAGGMLHTLDTKFHDYRFTYISAITVITVTI